MSPRTGQCYNPRDARGWRVPREGTKASAIYQLMIQGIGRRGITAVTGFNGFTVGVMMYCIRHPDKTNQLKSKYYVKRTPVPLQPLRQNDSAYVNKLISILGMTPVEARETERQLIEKERKSCPRVVNASSDG